MGKITTRKFVLDTSGWNLTDPTNGTKEGGVEWNADACCGFVESVRRNVQEKYCHPNTCYTRDNDKTKDVLSKVCQTLVEINVKIEFYTSIQLDLKMIDVRHPLCKSRKVNIPLYLNLQQHSLMKLNKHDRMLQLMILIIEIMDKGYVLIKFF